MPHVHFDREGERDMRADVLHLLPGEIGHAGHVDEEVVRPDADIVLVAAGAGGEVVHDRANAERRQNVRGNLQVELPSQRPRLLGGRVAQIDLAAHHHGDELVVRREVAVSDAGRILRILVAGNAAGALEIAERRAAAGVEQRLHRRVRMLRRMVDLRDVEHGGDAVVELREAAKQLVDVDVLRPVHRREFQQDVLVIGRVGARRARAVIDQDAVGEEAAQRRLELVVMRVDEARHHDAAARVDLVGVAGADVRRDGEDLLAFDEDVALRQVRHRRDPSTSRRRL